MKLLHSSFAFLGLIAGAECHDLPSPFTDSAPFHTAPAWFLAQADLPQPAGKPIHPSSAAKPGQVAAFAPFGPEVKVRWDEHSLFIESNGMPRHNLMVGITNWQQQVPLPQRYAGANAWSIPLVPIPATNPLSIKGRFLRGAIALAVNGIPIFNPQNNRGEISQEIGELDQWGGHCGRADDYHYHVAPLHLQDVVGKGMPIAYALDGYPLYGLTEPDGSEPTGLDDFHGHTTVALGYHYHASTRYPYVNGGFHGEVTEREGQVDPQPRAQPVRRDQPPLRGAKITAFVSKDATYTLTYQIGSEERSIVYREDSDGAAHFQYHNGTVGISEETYVARADRGAAGQPNGRPRQAEPRGAQNSERSEPAVTVSMDQFKRPNPLFSLTSPEVFADGMLPRDFTGDGSGATLPLVWKGAPPETQSYALVMDHLAPGNVVKSYWTLWDLPATVTSLPKDARGVGKLGTSFKGQVGYEPPHSQGPGLKTYVLTVYALSSPAGLTQSPDTVTRETLLLAIKDKILASASLNVSYAREGADRAASGPGGPPRQDPPRR